MPKRKRTFFDTIPCSKPHFKQLFAEKGNYDFGGTNPNHKAWENSKGPAPAASDAAAPIAAAVAAGAGVAALPAAVGKNPITVNAGIFVASFSFSLSLSPCR